MAGYLLSRGTVGLWCMAGCLTTTHRKPGHKSKAHLDDILHGPSILARGAEDIPWRAPASASWDLTSSSFSWLGVASLAWNCGLVQPVTVRATQWYLETKLLAIICHLQATALRSFLVYSALEAWVWRWRICPRKGLWEQKGPHSLKLLRHSVLGPEDGSYLH